MSQTSENTAKKSENNSNATENWLQKAIKSIPHGLVRSKVEEICEACETSKPSFYRWMKTGYVPLKSHRDKILDILNYDLNTQTTKNH